MPRDSGGVWTDIPGITAVPGQTIESADWNNYRADLRNNEFNSPRPITAGGTGATNAVDALNNLGGVGVSNFLDAYPVGDFYGTIRTLDSNWLRRDGNLYLVDDYPELAALLPPLADDVQWSNVTVGQTGLTTILAKPANTGFLIGRQYDVSGVSTSDIYSSSDGEGWSAVATIGSGFAVGDIAYGGGIYLAADNNGKAYTSNDSISWSSSSASIPGGTGAGVTSVAYGAGVFVATTLNSTGKYVHSSPDGATWTLRYTVPGGSGAPTLERVRFVNNNFVAVGRTGNLVTSPDGIVWTLRTTGTSNNLLGITYGNGLYVAVGAAGTIITSPNLSAWTIRTSGTPNQLNYVEYSTAGFLAVGNGGVARISSATSGTTWVAPGGTGSSQDLLGIAYQANQPSRYFVVQRLSPSILKGIRTLPTQFQVPSDDPVYGWIRAVPQDT